MNSAMICLHYQLPMICLLVPGGCNTSSLSIKYKKHTWEHIVSWNWEYLACWEWTWKHRASRLEVYYVTQLGTYVRVCLEVCLRASWETTYEHIWLWVYHHVQLDSLLRACSEVYLRCEGSQEGWVYSLACSAEVDRASPVTGRCAQQSRTEPQLMYLSKPPTECRWVFLEHLGVCLDTSWELSCEHRVKQLRMCDWV